MKLEQLEKKVHQVLKGKEAYDAKKTALIGRKGILTLALREIGQLPAAERSQAGAALNKLRLEVLAATDGPATTTTIEADLTAPAVAPTAGTVHPISQTVDRMVDIFVRLGFDVVEGPELVSDWENFGSLHFSTDHPARDSHDSFLTKDLPGWLMRTQTSSMQVPAIATRKPPLRFIVPGKTYRREADATHMPMFNQLEGVIVDEQVSFADLKGLLEEFVAEFFGYPVPMRFRPHYFPFTEPSAEVDIYWEKKDGTGRWLETLGCGVIHPEVLQNAGLDPRRYQGVAFGFGIERYCMLRHGLDDMRELYENNPAIIQQWRSLT